MMKLIYKFTPLEYSKSPEDKRDYISTAVIPQDISVDGIYSLRDKSKYVINQKDTGICVGCASAAIKNIQEYIDGDLPDGGLSPIYIYRLCKTRDGIPQIEGTYPRTALDVIYSLGSLPEKDLPLENYLNTKILPNITESQIEKAMKYKIKSYARIPDGNITALKQAIKEQGAVLCGLLVTDSFVYPEGGKFIGEPSGTFYGGHTVSIIGFNDQLIYTYKNNKTYKGFIEIQNSWGTGFGDRGVAYIPYEMITNCPTDIGFILEMWSSIDEASKLKYYRCQTGAFSIKENAQKLAIELKSKGFATYMVFVDNLWKIQIGAFTIKSNAEKLSQKLTNTGYKNWITYY